MRVFMVFHLASLAILAIVLIYKSEMNSSPALQRHARAVETESKVVATLGAQPKEFTQRGNHEAP